MNGSDHDAIAGLPAARQRWSIAINEPSASPSGVTWHAKASDSASSMTLAARSNSTMPIAPLIPQSPEDLLDPGSSCYRRIDREGKLWGPFQPQLSANGRLEPDPILDQRLLGLVGHRRQQHGGVAEIGVDVDRGDGQQIDAFVG